MLPEPVRLYQSTKRPAECYRLKFEIQVRSAYLAEAAWSSVEFVALAVRE